MLYEFAMTPDLYDASVINTDANEIIIVELLRGLAENGLLANLHKDRWLRHICQDRIIALPPAVKDKILSCLSVLHDRHRLVRHPKCMNYNPSSDSDWLKLALDSHQRIPFHAIILSQCLTDNCGQRCDAFVEFSGALDSPQWSVRRQRTLQVLKSEAGYRTALAPVLRYSKSLSLVDPFFCTENPLLTQDQERFFKTIEICSNLMGQRGHTRLQGRIHIHAELRKQKPDGLTLNDYLGAWERKIRPLIGIDGHRFKVFLWESLPGSESLHDRFVLTDQCGISVPGGLDCRTHTHPNTTDWNLLDEDVRVKRWNEYEPLVSPFRLLGEREVS